MSQNQSYMQLVDLLNSVLKKYPDLSLIPPHVGEACGTVIEENVKNKKVGSIKPDESGSSNTALLDAYRMYLSAFGEAADYITELDCNRYAEHLMAGPFVDGGGHSVDSTFVAWAAPSSDEMKTSKCVVLAAYDPDTRQFAWILRGVVKSILSSNLFFAPLANGLTLTDISKEEADRLVKCFKAHWTCGGWSIGSMETYKVIIFDVGITEEKSLTVYTLTDIGEDYTDEEMKRLAEHLKHAVPLMTSEDMSER